MLANPMERHSQTPHPAGAGGPWPAACDDAAAFDLLLAYEQRVLEGAPDDFEALCAARPELAAALRRLRAAPPPGAHSPLQATAQHLAPSSASPQGSFDLLSLAGADRARAARYERRGELGRGAMGVVYEVWDRELARSLAMKVLAASSYAARDPLAHAQRLQRFLREVRTAAQLDHPGIVPVHDFGLDQHGRPFFTMKRVHGRELKALFADVWRGEPEWTLARAVGALLKVCEAVDYAHSKGVVHRDLKPANVMIGPFGEVFVMDWGVAHLFEAADNAGAESSPSRGAASVATGGDGELTGDGDVIGTASYMAPEQAQGRLDAIGPAIDVYAVGAMLYHLLAERAPYVEPGGSNSSVVVMGRVLEGPPLTLARVASNAPVELVAIAEKAMARAVEQRYSHMGALAADLRAWLEGGVVGAHEVGAWAQLKKWVARNRALSAASAVAVLALTAGSGAVAYIESVRADEALAAGEKIRVEAQTSKRALGFLDEMFERLDPLFATGEQPTVRRFLEHAFAGAKSELDEEPVVRARLLQSIAAAYGWVGAVERSVEVFELAIDEATNAHGANSDEVLELRRRYALANVAAKEMEIARELIDWVASEYDKRDRSDDGVAIMNQRALGVVMMANGDFEQAEAVLRRAVDKGERCGDLDRNEVARLLKDHGECLTRLERAPEAIDQTLAWLEREKTRSSLDEATYGELDRWLSLAMERSGDWRGAEERLRSAVQRLESNARSAPWGHSRTLLALGNHLIRRSREVRNGQAVIDAEGRSMCEEGVAHLRRALDLGDSVVDTDSPVQRDLALQIAEYLYDLGRPQEALPYGERAVRAHRSSARPFNDKWSTSLKVLAQVHIKLGQWELAEPLARERLERAPPDDPHMHKRRELLEQIRAHLSADPASRDD